MRKRWDDATGIRIWEREEGSGEYTVREDRVVTIGNSISSPHVTQNIVKPKQEWCSCGKWQDHKFPCRHAMSFFKTIEANLPFQSIIDKYSHDFYKYESLHNLYKRNVSPVIIDHLRYDKIIQPPHIYIPTGRPRKKRMRARSKFIDKSKSTIHCSICNQAGHNKRGCKMASLILKWSEPTSTPVNKNTNNE